MSRADVERVASEIRRILKDDWDPIEGWTPDDEYDEFVWRVFGMLLKRASPAKISDYLQYCSDEYMKCPLPPDRAEAVANRLTTLDLGSLPSQAHADFTAVRRVLMDVWNPLGEGGWPEDEYDAYAWPVIALLRKGASDEELATHFRQVEGHYFGGDAEGGQIIDVIRALRAIRIGDEEEKT